MPATTIQAPWDPSAYLPLSTYSPEPNEQWASSTSPRTASLKTIPRSQTRHAHFDRSARQDVVRFQTPPAFASKPKPKKTPFFCSTSAPPLSEVPASSPTQYDASMYKIRRRLYALSTPSDPRHPEPSTFMTATSAALLARQTNDSNADLVPRHVGGPQEDRSEDERQKYQEPDAALRKFAPHLKEGISKLWMEDRTQRQNRPLIELSDTIFKSKEQVLPQPLVELPHELHSNHCQLDPGDPPRYTQDNQTGKVSWDYVVGVHPDAGLGTSTAPPTNTTWRTEDRPTGTRQTIFELAAADATSSKDPPWPISWPPYPSDLSPQMSELDVASPSQQREPFRAKTHSWQPPCSSPWLNDHPISRPVKPAPRHPSSSISPANPTVRTTPYCSTALTLQQSLPQPAWQSLFTFPTSSTEMVCSSCSSRIPTQSFQIRVQSSVWTVSECLLARSHKPSVSQNGNAQLGCVFCPGDQATFRSRNELWAHLETHEAGAFDGDADVLEVGRGC
jgi:hypothetical protein